MKIGGAEKLYSRLVRLLRKEDGQWTAFEAIHAPWILDPGIIGISFGQRLTDRGPTAEPVLIVHVQRKEKLAPEDLRAIPRQIRLDAKEIIGVDVRELSPATAASAVRPRGNGSHGQVASWVRLGKQDRLLTCSHVLRARQNPVEVESMSKWSLVGVATVVATLVPGSQKIQAEPDQALFQPKQALLASAAGWPRYARLSMTSINSSTTLVVRHPRQQRQNAGVLHPRVTERVGIGHDSFYFADLIKIEKVTVKGDSGSPVEDLNGNLVGYVIADTDGLDVASHFTLVQPIAPVLKGLNCTLPPASANPAYVSALRDAAVRAQDPVAGLHPPINLVPLPPDSREVDVLARTLWGEARDGGPLEMVALAHLVRNRLLRAPIDDERGRCRFGRDLTAICRNRRDFASWNNPALQMQVNEADPQFRRALDIAFTTLSGALGSDPTQGANFSRRTGEVAKWLKTSEVAVAIVGNREFYRRT